MHQFQMGRFICSTEVSMHGSVQRILYKVKLWFYYIGEFKSTDVKYEHFNKNSGRIFISNIDQKYILYALNILFSD